MLVVEIGCGNDAGPFFEGADFHYAIDINPNRVWAAVANDPTLTPIVGNAADLKFEDQSINTVLARNVFGDRTLGANTGLLEGVFNEGADVADQHKIKILKEASRILVKEGLIVVVEQHTPEQFLQFLDRVQHPDQWPKYLTPFSETTLEEVTPTNYSSRRRLGFNLRPTPTYTWVAARCSKN